MDRKKALIILGSDRSGTSALGGVLNNLGISMGKVLMPPAEENPKGFYENVDVTEFNDKTLLPAINSSWDDITPLHTRVVNCLLKRFDMIEKATSIIESHYSSDIIFGVKDPRMSVLFLFWERVFRILNIEINVILPYRNPIEVALSLQRRNNFSIEKGMLLWSQRSLYAEFYSRDYKRVFVSYDDLLNRTDNIIDKISHSLDVQFPKDYQEVKSRITDFLDSKLRHHNKSNLEDHDYKYEFIHRTRDLFEALSADKVKDDKFLREKFDILRTEYNSFVFELELNQQKSKNEELLNELAALKLELNQQKSKNEELLNELAGVYLSKSWRITRPLRSLKRKLKNIKMW